jgi:hypothetical protein
MEYLWNICDGVEELLIFWVFHEPNISSTTLFVISAITEGTSTPNLNEIKRQFSYYKQIRF